MECRIRRPKVPSLNLWLLQACCKFQLVSYWSPFFFLFSVGGPLEVVMADMFFSDLSF